MEKISIESENIKIGKLDFKESKYSTGKRKTSIARIWLKKELDKYMLMEEKWMIILKDQTTKTR